MKKLKQVFNMFCSLKLYYQVPIAMISFVLAILLIRFLFWLVPILFVLFIVMIIFTEGDIINFCWNRYKQSKQIPENPLLKEVYHWLTENVNDLPISTLQVPQGVESTYSSAGVYFVHLKKEISDAEFDDFEIKVRQFVTFISNGFTDCVVSRSQRDPFIAIKIRLVPSNELMHQQRYVQAEDF